MLPSSQSRIEYDAEVVNTHKKAVFVLLAFVLSLMCSCKAPQGPDLSIACAANMQFAMEKWVRHYEDETGQKVQLTISSSGKIFAQIREGGPWDLFFSADKKYPLELAKLGFGVQAPHTYAQGRLILLSRHKRIGGDPCDWLSSQKVKMAVANPKTAPYGEAARLFMSNCGVLNSLSDQLVFGESISQVNRFFLTESVDLALTAQSMLYSDKLPDSIFHAFISTRYYNPIEQDYLILNNSSPVKRFLTYIQSDSGQAVLRRFGYF